jgi:hypothetical protein
MWGALAADPQFVLWRADPSRTRPGKTDKFVVNPTTGVQRITYIRVVKGRKIMPRIGHNQLPPKAALNMTGRAIQMNRVPRRGKKPANIANKQGMIFSPLF